jgi:hypothetical protein
LKSWVLDRKLGGLQDKMKAESHERVIVFDFERTFTENEKALINKTREALCKFEVNPSADLFDENIKIILKVDEVYLNYAMFTLREILLCQFGNPNSEIDQWYFNLHFYNFLLDLTECLQRVRNWPKGDKEIFLKNLEDGLKNKVYRLPRDSHSNLDQTANLSNNKKANAGSSKNKSKVTRTRAREGR